MKKLLTFSASLLIGIGSMFAQQEVEVFTEYGLWRGGGVEVDLNNDGYMDFITGGLTRENYTITDADGNDVETDRGMYIFLYSPEEGKYKKIEAGFRASDRAQFVVADLNGDGIMDLVISEAANMSDDYGVVFIRAMVTAPLRRSLLLLMMKRMVSIR